MEKKGYRSGFVTIVGCPNTGKSTLLNSLIGQKIAIVSDRAQTTRNKITGVLSGNGYQIVFMDTPGVTGAKNKLGDYMMQVVSDALNEVEAILLVLDPVNGVRERDEALLERLKSSRAPVIALLNKQDAASAKAMDEARDALKKHTYLSDVQSVSAKTGDGLESLIQRLLPLLPEGPQYFPEDMVTDQPERVICAELIREKALRLLRDEIPHGIGVGVDKMEQRDGLMDVYATLYCERPSHKGIIIGKGGSMLKRIGQDARHDIEWMLGMRVNLQLWIKVKEDWRNKTAILHELGYE